MTHSLIALPETLLPQIHASLRNNLQGEVARYIPELGKVAPDQLGVAVMLAKGELISVGDCESPFTIQSVSKAFSYAMLLDALGPDEVAKVVGVQPSGEPFNNITLDPRTQRPFNPMLNAGAIAVAGGLYECFGEESFARMLRVFGDAAGRPLAVDEAVFQSEQATGDRNRAIGHLLRAAGVFKAPVDAVLELYFRQCSVLVTARDLAAMAATLSNLGTHPRTDANIFSPLTVRQTLSVMFTCGMYDGAGNWACNVGVPAKSGVGGGILAVINRQLGIGVFSPRLDAAGNSVRGQLACIHLAEELGLHVFDSSNAGSALLDAR
jgi:glutaminase